MGVSAVSSLGKALWKHKISTAMNTGFGIMSYNDSIDKGEGVGMALAGAAADTALPMVVGGWAYAGLQIAEMAPSAVVGAIEMSRDFGSSIARSSNSTFSNAQFQDSQQYQTMRQAGMAVIERSKYNQQLAMLGDEARYMHR